jgi:hypothetical protein
LMLVSRYSPTPEPWRPWRAVCTSIQQADPSEISTWLIVSLRENWVNNPSTRWRETWEKTFRWFYENVNIFSCPSLLSSASPAGPEGSFVDDIQYVVV